MTCGRTSSTDCFFSDTIVGTKCELDTVHSEWACIKEKHAVNSSQGFFFFFFTKTLFHWDHEETCVKFESVLQRQCSLFIDLFPREVTECGVSLMLEERESVFLLCCCHRLLRAAPGTNGASSGPLFPSDGHSWGRSATQSWGYTPPPHPAAASSPLCSCLPVLLCHCLAWAISLLRSAHS